MASKIPNPDEMSSRRFTARHPQPASQFANSNAPLNPSQAEYFPCALPDYTAVDAALTALLSANLRLWQMWFVSLMMPHRIEGLPLAGASQHDLPNKPVKRSA